jgi:hypothetical protein
MQTSMDLLRQKRDSGYGTDTPASGERSFSLTPEELQSIGQKGGPVTCQVTGTLSPDGKLMIQSVTAPGGGAGAPPMQNPS